MATIDDIISRAQQVRDETTIGANTASRVGGVMTDTAEEIKDVEAEVFGLPETWDGEYNNGYLDANGAWKSASVYNSNRKTLTNGHTYKVTLSLGEGGSPTTTRLFSVTRDGGDVSYTQVQTWSSAVITYECPDTGEYLLQSSYRKADMSESEIRDLTLESSSVIGRLDAIEEQIGGFGTIDSVEKDSTNAVTSGAVFNSIYYENANSLYIFPEDDPTLLYGVPKASYNHLVNDAGDYIVYNYWGSARIELIPSHTYRVQVQRRTDGIYIRVFRISGTEGNYTWEQVAYKKTTTGGSWDYTCPDDGNIYVCQVARYTTIVGMPSIVDLNAITYTEIKDEVDGLDFGNSEDLLANATKELSYYIYSDGSKMRRTSEPTDIAELYTTDIRNFKRVRVHTAPGGTATYGIYAVAFYSSEDINPSTFISGCLTYGGSAEPKIYHADVPENAVVMCVSNNTLNDQGEGVEMIGYYSFAKMARAIDEAVEYEHKNHLKVCVLGNSYTCDSFMYVPFILKNFGITCDIHLYYRGSGSIQSLINEWTDSSASSNGHSRFHYAVDTRTEDAWVTETRMSSKEIVELKDDWDMIITTNQSVASLDPTSFANVDTLVQLINASMPNPYTLGYSISYTRKSSDNPTLSLSTQTSEIKKHAFAVVFPVGTAVFDGRQNATLAALGDTGDMWVDNVHLQDGIPCYLAALSVVERIFREYGLGFSVLQDSLRPTEEWCVAHAIKDRQGGTACGLSQSDNVTLNLYLAQKAAIVANNNPAEIIAI